jgi:hypothetical protein
MKAADEALYLAKAQGRNKVVLHPPEAALDSPARPDAPSDQQEKSP